MGNTLDGEGGVDPASLGDVQAWCSWCFELARHTRVQENSVRRSIYACQECGKRTLLCRRCQPRSMARGHSFYDDELCMVCDGTLDMWGSRPPAKVERPVGHCPWCLKDTTHKLQQVNVVRRNVHACEECGRQTVRCVKCQKAFARTTNVGRDDMICESCDESISSWIGDAVGAKSSTEFQRPQYPSTTPARDDGLSVSPAAPYSAEFVSDSYRREDNIQGGDTLPPMGPRDAAIASSAGGPSVYSAPRPPVSSNSLSATASQAAMPVVYSRPPPRQNPYGVSDDMNASNDIDMTFTRTYGDTTTTTPKITNARGEVVSGGKGRILELDMEES